MMNETFVLSLLLNSLSFDCLTLEFSYILPVFQRATSDEYEIKEFSINSTKLGIISFFREGKIYHCCFR